MTLLFVHSRQFLSQRSKSSKDRATCPSHESQPNVQKHQHKHTLTELHQHLGIVLTSQMPLGHINHGPLETTQPELHRQLPNMNMLPQSIKSITMALTIILFKKHHLFFGRVSWDGDFSWQFLNLNLSSVFSHKKVSIFYL